MKAAEVTTPKLATIRPDETVREVARIMLQFGISGLPVVDPFSADTELPDVVWIMEHRHIKRVPVVSDGKIVGIISPANLVQALARLADEVPKSRSDDEAIHARILAELDKQAWAPGASINVIVRNGVYQELHRLLLNDK